MTKRTWGVGGGTGRWAPSREASGPTPCDFGVLSEIGRHLKEMYAEFVREPLPEHLAAVLRKLEAGR